LFAGTIRENLLCCKPEATETEIRHVIEIAQLGDFISGLPAGLDTQIGERGVRISGGERQRISIARALMKDPPILIQDEATSSVDSISENMIKQALRHLLEERTCFIIAHRLTTVLDADQIIVLEGGKIVGRGTHDELYNNNSIYSRLYNEQFAVGASAAVSVPEEHYLMEEDAQRSRIVVRTDQTGYKQVKITRISG
jgi:ABC-type multidrug transport system fused ATPase/permease subunit